MAIEKNRYFFKNIWWVPLVLLFGIGAVAMPRYAFLALGIPGLFLIFLGTYQVKRAFNLAQWEQHIARILSIKEVSEDVYQTPTVSVKYSYPELNYEYEVNGRNYSGNRVGINIESIWLPEVDNLGNPTKESEKYWLEWDEGENIPVYVNPLRPEEAVVFNQPNRTSRSHSFALMLGGFLLIIASLTLPGLS